MAEPTIICHSCGKEIPLTESLAAPLVEATRRQYEQRIAAKDAEVARREAAVKEQQAALVKSQESLDEQVAAKLKSERVGIAAEEARKAKLAFSTDLDQQARELADLQEVIRQKDAKLTEAQKAQAELIRKQRELDDAKREMELTIETRVQQSLGSTREQAKKEAEESLKLPLKIAPGFSRLQGRHAAFRRKTSSTTLPGSPPGVFTSVWPATLSLDFGASDRLGPTDRFLEAGYKASK